MKKYILAAVAILVSLTFTACGGGDSKEEEETEEVVAEAPNWKATDAYAFESTMTACFTLPSTMKLSTKDELAVLCGDEVRGVATRVNVSGSYVWMVVIGADPGDVLTVKYYSASAQRIYTSTSVITFTADAQAGTPDAPQELTF